MTSEMHSKIRNFYTPLQHSVIHTSDDVVYTEVFPDPRLQSFIYCYWQFKTNIPLNAKFNHLIVADGCIDIFFELSNPQDSYVMGFCKKHTEFVLENTFNYVGIRFLPTMFPQLFNVNAKELSNRLEHLQNVIPKTSTFIKNNFNMEMDITKIKGTLDDYFLQIVSGSSFVWDNRLYDSILLILKNHGSVDLAKDLNTGISERQLRRLFEFYIGGTPKTFSNLIRFQSFLKAKPSSESLRKNKLFYDIGYYDQAHFIKEFKNFYGVTPSKAFKR